MELEFMWKDDDSNISGCPALYRVDGGYVVQGKKLPANIRDQARQLADDEDLLFVPANVLDKLKGL
jgi:hypothetical protein